MAKVGFYLRGARGKLAGAVFQRGADGATVAREIVKPKNPKTSGQLAQRMIFATATAAYSKMKAICDHSLEGVQYGSKSQQEFMKYNLQMLRERAANNYGDFLAKGVNVLIENPYIISKGSLESVRDITYDKASVLLGMPSTEVDNKKIITVGEACGNWGIDKGDQITIVAISYNDATNPVATVDNYGFYNQQLCWMRITIKADAANDDVVYNVTNKEWGNAAIVETNNVRVLNYDPDEEKMYLIAEVGDFTAAAVIHSKKSGDAWLRSNETMHVFEGAQAKFLSMLSTWFGNSTSINFENPYILNNAEPGSPAPVSTLVGATVKATTATTPAATKVVPNVAMINGGKYTGCALVKFSTDGTKVTFYEFVDTTTVKETTAEYLTNSLSSYLIELNEAEQVLNYQLTVQPAA